MTKDDKEIVSAILRELAGKVGQERFDLWFGVSVQFQLDGQTLLVCAADRFSLDRIRRQFRTEIAAAVQETLGYKVELDFRVDEAIHTEAIDTGASEANADQNDSNGSGEIGALATRSKQSGRSRKPGKPGQTNSKNGRACKTSSSGNRAERNGNQASGLNRRRFSSLASFSVGDCNRLAYTAAQMVAPRLGSVSPLFVYGPTGTGKTHLLEGIWSDVRRKSAASRIVYLSAEQFTSYFLEALKGSGLPSFRRKYRDVELLLIDDVQFFAGKRATMVELLHTIDTLLRGGRQLVLAADRPPAEMTGLGQELIARMAGGLVCGMEPPERATRLEIVQGLALRRGENIPREVIELIADQITGDARRLGGALNQVSACSMALKEPVSLSMARSALVDMIQSTQRVIGLVDIDRAVCDVFGLEPKTLQSTRQGKTISGPRMLAMWLARKYTRSPFSEISVYFGRRSHTTVIAAEKKISRWLENGESLPLAHGDCRIEDALRRVESNLRTA